MQPGDQITQHIAFEYVSILYLEGNGSRAKLLDEALGIGVAAEENGAVWPARALSMQFEHALRNI